MLRKYTCEGFETEKERGMNEGKKINGYQSKTQYFFTTHAVQE
jgi:hypothetical protein